MPLNPRNLLSVLLLIVPCFSAIAQQSGVVGTSEREIRILQERSEWARKQIAKANEAMSDTSLNGKDYESAFALSKSALDALPASGAATSGLRSMASDTFAHASLGLARLRISEGRYEDAETVIAAATGKPYDCTYPPLLTLKKDLATPGAINRTMTPGFVVQVDQVKQFLSDAQGYYASGRFDEAFKAYEKVLNIDPQNTSARLGMEQVDKQRSSYAETAYNERRSEMIGQVAGAWELPVQKYNVGASSIVEQNPIEIKGVGAIGRKLREIKIPKIDFQGVTLRESLESIKNLSKTMDTTENDNSKKGINIVVMVDNETAEKPISLTLNDVTLESVLNYICLAASVKYKKDPYAVIIIPPSRSAQVESKYTREFAVLPNFFTSIAPEQSSSSTTSGGLPQTAGKFDVKEIFKTQGVTFPDDSVINYSPNSGKLFVKNTQANLDLIESILEAAGDTTPFQVEIQARYLEVSQNNIQELGFDWLLGAFNLGSGSGVYGGGGTSGNQGSGGPWPMQMNGTPVGSITGDGTGNLTAGNRTGSAAIRANALDGLLYGSPVGPAAGVLALAGVFTNPQFQVVLRAINQQKGVDLVSAPKVTVTSGRQASINIVRKFPYPRNYQAPQVAPATVGGGVQPSTPATPTDFETKSVGVELKVTPTVTDRTIIDLELNPKVVEFQGFVNYGTPIYTYAPVLGPDGFGTLGSQKVLLTSNSINQPVFSVREVDTKVTVNDGQTVVLGGLMREDVQKVQDKTPILGDAPLIGSLFRSSSNQRIKRNLLIFVTAGLLDPSGQPLIKAIQNGQEVPVPDAKATASEAVAGDASTASKVH